MTAGTKERIGVMVMSGPREGQVVLVDPEIVSGAPRADDFEAAYASGVNAALDSLNASLDRFIRTVGASADEYARAAARLEAHP